MPFHNVGAFVLQEIIRTRPDVAPTVGRHAVGPPPLESVEATGEMSRKPGLSPARSAWQGSR
jgi:hypothetical protein